MNSRTVSKMVTTSLIPRDTNIPNNPTSKSENHPGIRDWGLNLWIANETPAPINPRIISPYPIGSNAPDAPVLKKSLICWLKWSQPLSAVSALNTQICNVKNVDIWTFLSFFILYTLLNPQIVWNHCNDYSEVIPLIASSYCTQCFYTLQHRMSEFKKSFPPDMRADNLSTSCYL